MFYNGNSLKNLLKLNNNLWSCRTIKTILLQKVLYSKFRWQLAEVVRCRRNEKHNKTGVSQLEIVVTNYDKNLRQMVTEKKK